MAGFGSPCTVQCQDARSPTTLSLGIALFRAVLRILFAFPGEKLELKTGENYQMKIIRLVPEERKIGLSIRALKDEQYRADWEAYTDSSGRPEATLGDHFKHLK